MILPKLSPAQRALLLTADKYGHLDCIESYVTARKLVALGLAKVKEAPLSSRVVLTSRGAEVLAELKKEKP